MTGYVPRPELHGIDPSADPSTRYDIVGRIADGAMGQVYLARMRRLRAPPKHVVLKRIRPELQEEPDIVVMFQDEARIAAQMDHPNIVRLYEVGELDGSLFLAMELVEGVTLQDLLSTLVERRSFLPVEMALRIACDALDALDYAHRFTDAEGHPLKIVHRDVSPQNLMVTYSGTVKLLDFGVTRAEGRLTGSLPGLLKGKLAYMPPEAIEGNPVDSRADLFSLGTVLYELLLLQHPFPGQTDAMVLRSIVEEPPIPPTELDPRFPDALADILMSALAKDPVHRVPTAADFKDALDAFMQDRGLVASRNGLSQYLRELYADRVEAQALARAAGDDLRLLQAVRGHALRLFAPRREVRSRLEGRYKLPHSLTDLEYARVPTADLPAILRPVGEEGGGFRRRDLQDILPDAYPDTEPSPRSPAEAEGLSSPVRMMRYQMLEVLDAAPDQIVQKARLQGPHGFRKTVVLRRLPPERARSPEWVAPFVREAKLRANLNHPHIEALLDFHDQPEVFMVVEPIEGWALHQTLAACTRQHRAPPPLPIVLRITLDVVEALEYLHGLPEPILHRSIDPWAVRVHRSGRAKLTGFAYARRVDSRMPDRFDQRRSRLDRAPPEIVDPERGPETTATDVYGVTLLFAESLSLSRPFSRDTPEGVTQSILQGIDESTVQALPEPVREAVARGLGTDPSARFAGMGALRAALLAVGIPADRPAVCDWFEGR